MARLGGLAAVHIGLRIGDPVNAFVRTRPRQKLKFIILVKGVNLGECLTQLLLKNGSRELGLARFEELVHGDDKLALVLGIK